MMRRGMAILLLGLALTLDLVAASESRLATAQQLIDAGQLEPASKIYREILLSDPSNPQANYGLATIRAWQGDYVEAEYRYQVVLEQQPDYLPARTGLGYTLGWSQKFDQAEYEFDQILKSEPANLEAIKGKAYVALWRGNGALAEKRFTELLQNDADNTEFLLAIGQAQVLQMNSSRAIQTFETVLALEPSNQAARDGVLNARALPARFDATVLYGSNEEDTGLRQVEIGSWLSRDFRLWLRVDDSLSLDVPDLSEGDARTTLVGFSNRFDSNWISNFELGNRDLDGGQSQDIFGLEMVNLGSPRVYRFGFQLAPHSEDYTDRLLHGGIVFPFDDDWFLEPSLYLSSTGEAENDNWRLLTRVGFRSPAGWELDFSIGYGEDESEVAEFDGNVTTANVTWRMPLSRFFDVFLIINTEDTPADELTTTILGINFRQPRS